MKKRILLFLAFLVVVSVSTQLVSSNRDVALVMNDDNTHWMAMPLIGSLALVVGFITGYRGRKWYRKWYSNRFLKH